MEKIKVGKYERLKNDIKIKFLEERLFRWNLWYKENFWFFIIIGKIREKRRMIKYLRNDFKRRIDLLK